MATINLPGLSTGIDTSQIIQQLMAVERRSLNLYEERKSTWDERKSALSTLEGKLSNLKSAASCRRQSPRSQGVSPQASPGIRNGFSSWGGAIGLGWVTAARSPGICDGGTGPRELGSELPGVQARTGGHGEGQSPR